MKLSAVLTFRDGIRLGYPFLESVLSMMPIVDEYLINDGGSTDGSWECLKRLEEVYPDKVRLYRMKDYKSIRWDCVTEQYNKMFNDAEGDWIFQGDADELMHENEIMGFKGILGAVKEAQVLRHLRHEIFKWWSEIGWYDYWPARTIRGGLGLFQDWKSHGGDEFMEKDTGRWLRHPPECKRLCGYKIWHFYLMFPDNNLPKRQNDAEFIATGAVERVKQYLWHKEHWKNVKIPEWFGERVVAGMPVLMKHHVGKMAYEIDERLFDPEYLSTLTGVNYFP